MIEIEKIIKLKKQIGKKEDIKNPFHIAFGVDKNFIRPAGVTITSIIKNNPDIYFHFHLLTTEITDNDLKKIKNIDKEKSLITIYWFDASIFQSLQEKENLPISMYYRLIIPNLLQKFTDRVLYLDADIICLSSISNLKEIDFRDNVAGVVNQKNIDKKNIYSLNLKDKNFYFNSGVLLINIPQWISRNILSEFMKTINLREYLYPDQDVLNIILEDKIIPLPSAYNRFNEDRNLSGDDTVFLHFTGTPKPWKSWHEQSDIYIEYYSISPWKDIPFELPTQYRQMRVYAKKLWRKKKYISSARWFILYIFNKLTK
ncbi:lipopolysaccharide-alpha-1, 3-D-galactosyltransferase [Xenorhabdus stockiae]|uniref:Lipopolysaccharide-alpha-1, 3-D-galactosyltransferase n=1 Tax=Xenorhabdus stockiae TaxID=351614 RepID=A0A2D0KSL2_9GAMM|nr:glycosyltransferase [Xenorhabdus stockiae]PHM66197.1 lipopolysaccharide-alpha-1, 3-D-galactosyltransferase [Xenorhabdus stockiae]